MLKKLWMDEAGTLVSVELLLIVSLVTIVSGLAWNGVGAAISAAVGTLSGTIAGLDLSTIS